MSVPLPTWCAEEKAFHCDGLPSSRWAWGSSEAPSRSAWPGSNTNRRAPPLGGAPAKGGGRGRRGRIVISRWVSPTDADPSDDYVIRTSVYALSYSATKNVANWVSWNLDAADLGHVKRTDHFLPDEKLPAAFSRSPPTTTREAASIGATSAPRRSHPDGARQRPHLPVHQRAAPTP